MKKMMTVVLVAIVATLAGCKGSENLVALLKGHEWQLKSFTADGAVVANPEELPILEFSSKSKMSGTAGCNNFFGTYATSNKGTITLVPGGVTMMACPDMEFEDRYMKALTEVKTYDVSKEELTLKDAKGKVVIVYTAASSKSAE